MHIGAKEKKSGVVHLAHSRGHCSSFWPSVPPLQVAPSIACSVASLSRFPGLQLPRSCSLHYKISTDYLLGWGEPSTRSAERAVLQSTPLPKRVQGANPRRSIKGGVVLRQPPHCGRVPSLRVPRGPHPYVRFYVWRVAGWARGFMRKLNEGAEHQGRTLCWLWL